MAKGSKVDRPQKSHEYRIVFGSRDAEKGWQDLRATQRNVLADAWDALTKNPLELSPQMHPLKGSLGGVFRGGLHYEQRQFELSGGARIWFYVDEMTVVLVNVHTRHPNQTK